MNRKHACICAFLITALIASTVYLLSPHENERETVLVARVIDGDTLTLEDGRKVRLANINSPEKGLPNYEQSLNFLKIYENQTIEIEIIKKDKYYRELARIYSSSTYINLELVELGLANKFLVQQDELKEFDKAEKSAIEGSKGIWQKSPHFSCLESEIDEQGEIVTLTNLCDSLNIENWTITDESTKEYKFGKIELEVIKIHSGNGKDTETEIFWNAKTNVWNNDRDSLYLFDEEGKIAHYNSYGY